ncbi:CoA transferase subunit A [Alkalicoccus daliensis]|uniref:Glutaconate CoA-transferase subunit A n=1 Tax=Alkalicoccus daliensis TaxID=745820 RepID=A0A1H0HCQ9_9BACI|nr:CoA-transferase [Alkalicoccus daliensis]SDO16932.1 glutaconate CoA-transferase subunit A [Alkalicoccus daliensis]
MSKRMELEEAIKQFIRPGSRLCFSGNALHRAPMAAVREIARQEISKLKIVKTAGALDIDLLCAMGLVDTVDAGFVSYESVYGLCMHYRKGVEEKRITGNEHACYTVLCALRGAIMNVPFMPVHGLLYSDLLVENDYFKVVDDPFGGQEPVTLVKTLKPDVAIIHVHQADEQGNAIINGAKYDDEIIWRAADHVIITAEKIIPSLKGTYGKKTIDIPGFMTDAVIEVPGGAKPCSYEGLYEVDHRMLKKFLSGREKKDHQIWLDNYDQTDRKGLRQQAGGFRR